MDWPNIQEMPIHHSKYLDTIEDLNTVLEYCINDVSSTKQILKLCSSQVMMRKKLSDEYKLLLQNASEPRLSKELFVHFLSKKMKIKKYDLKQLRTKRDQVIVQDIILDYVSFDNLILKEVHKYFKGLVIPGNVDLKGIIKYRSRTDKKITIDFGLGGIHGIGRKGIWETRDNMVIMSVDVTSFYPRLAMINKWSPAHLDPEAFCEQYEWFFNERQKLSKKDIKNYVFKIILNATFGLSIDEHSPFYDIQYGLQTTINGQLSLLMLYEMLSNIPGSEPIMMNTDGLEIRIPINFIENYNSICKEWEKITGLNLENERYDKILLWDVNNYIAVYAWKEVDVNKYLEIKQESPHYLFKTVNGKYYYSATKCKGRFEFTDLALHKNKSFLIIPKAIYNYFVHDISPEETLMKNHNIYDYCAGNRTKSDWKFIKIVTSGQYKTYEEPLQKVIRYYVSNEGCGIVKRNITDGREIRVEAGKNLSIFNTFIDKPWSEYNINTGFYLKKIYDEITSIENNKNQLELF